jgi:hypothetical protein
VECKTTSAKSYSLHLSDLEKIKVEALKGNDSEWAMQVEFQAATGKRRFAIIDWQSFLDLRNSQELLTGMMKDIQEPSYRDVMPPRNTVAEEKLKELIFEACTTAADGGYRRFMMETDIAQVAVGLMDYAAQLAPAVNAGLTVEQVIPIVEAWRKEHGG